MSGDWTVKEAPPTRDVREYHAVQHGGVKFVPVNSSANLAPPTPTRNAVSFSGGGDAGGYAGGRADVGGFAKDRQSEGVRQDKKSGSHQGVSSQQQDGDQQPGGNRQWRNGDQKQPQMRGSHAQDVRDLGRTVGNGSQAGGQDSQEYSRANSHGSQLGDHRTDGHGSQPDRRARQTTASETGSHCGEDENSAIGHGSQLGGSPRTLSGEKWVNEVDSWIDDLELNRRNDSLDANSGAISSSVLMASLIQQQLPKVEIPPFDGSPLNWVEFIVKFRDVVHEQPYLNDKQRNQQLLQHLPQSLKKLKYLFGQRPIVARAVLSKVT